MNEECLIICVCAALFAGAWLAIRCCADAVHHGGRHWWIRAVFRGQQRVEYREFSRSLEQAKELDRMVR
jgi:hypothetical protein